MDVVIDVAVMEGVADQVRRASAAMETERTLSAGDAGAFGAPIVESAYIRSAHALDESTRVLSEDAAKLGDFVTTAASSMTDADAGLAAGAS